MSLMFFCSSALLEQLTVRFSQLYVAFLKLIVFQFGEEFGVFWIITFCQVSFYFYSDVELKFLTILNLENPLLSDWLTHGVSLILLILLNCSNSVLVRGVYIDAEEPAGQCVIFPVYYIRLFFQKERTKKNQRLMEKLEKIDQNNTVLLIEKPQMNHATSEIIIKNSSLTISNEDLKSENDKNNDNLDQSGENTILCE